MGKLTDLEIKRAKEPGKLSDGHGLHVLIAPNGSKLWRYNYRFSGKHRTLALGEYPAVGLAQARRKHEDARRLLHDNVDPSAKRKQDRIVTRVEDANTFGALAREYIQKRLVETGKAPATIKKNGYLLTKKAAALTDRPIKAITTAELYEILERVERSGQNDSAHSLRDVVGSVFRFAIQTGRAEYDPTFALKGALNPVKVTPRAALTEEGPFGGLLAAIDEREGWLSLTAILQFLALTFVRPGEARHAEWRQIKADVWTIPAERTKMRREHLVPLSKQALRVLERVRPLSGHCKLIFPAIRTMRRPLSENAMNAALRGLGYTKEEHTAHGFRASTSSILNNRGFRGDVIEFQLAHKEKNKSRAPYNRAEYWNERVGLMQDWADLCDEFKRPKWDNSDLI